jgi:hypothetical protein
MLALSVELPRPGAGQPAARLSLRAARELLVRPASPSADRDAVWSQLVRLAVEKKEPWDVAAVWMMVPGLRKICGRCRRYGTTLDATELEAEAVAGFVEALYAADPDRPELGSWLWWTTYRHVHREDSRRRGETPTADIELVGSLETCEYDASRSALPGATADHPCRSRRRRVGLGERRDRGGRAAGRPRAPARARARARPEFPGCVGTSGESRMTGRPLTFPELFALPTVVDLRTAARAVGISIGTAYKMVYANRFPCPVMRLGWRYQVSTAALMKALDIDRPAVHLDDVHRGAAFARNIE